LQDVFAKHEALLKELGVNPNNGLGDLYDKIKGHPLQETIEKDIQVNIYISMGWGTFTKRHPLKDTIAEIIPSSIRKIPYLRH
jgi:Monomeric isocitrate dehydrogenase